MRKIGLGADHGGFALKEIIKKHLLEKGYEVEDFGTYSTESVDYPKFGKLVANAVLSKSVTCGILICGTGIGISIAANRVPGIRAALCTNTTMVKLSREHNDANILALGERIVGVALALEMVDVFLSTEFEKGRHSRRVESLDSSFC